MAITEKLVKKIEKKIDELKEDEWLKEVDWENVRAINNVDEYKE